jgi:hypothetical protein
MNLFDLLKTEGSKYIRDAMPGGRLNPEVSGQGLLDTLALGTAPVPVVGDVAGLAADVTRMVQNPEERTLGNAALAGLGLLPFVPAMTVFHGSPHLFQRFDASKIGTGEGAQAYGHGLYLAESPDVARGYQQATSKDRFVTSQGFFDPSELEHLNVKAEVRKGDLDKAIRLAKKYAKPDEDYPETAAKAARDLAKLQSVKAAGGMRQNTGALYQVDLPDEQIARMLDFDKPLSEQPEIVKRLNLSMDNGRVNALVDSEEGGQMLWRLGEYPSIDAALNEITGQKLNALLKRTSTPAESARVMRQAGIPGIRYLDQGSRGAGQGTSNFVVFPGMEDMLRIEQINEQPIQSLFQTLGR